MSILNLLKPTAPGASKKSPAIAATIGLPEAEAFIVAKAQECGKPMDSKCYQHYNS